MIYTVEATTDGRGRLVMVTWTDEGGTIESFDVAEAGVRAVALRLSQVLAAPTAIVQVADGDEMRIGLALNAALSAGGYDHLGIRVTAVDD